MNEMYPVYKGMLDPILTKNINKKPKFVRFCSKAQGQKYIVQEKKVNKNFAEIIPGLVDSINANLIQHDVTNLVGSKIWKKNVLGQI